MKKTITSIILTFTLIASTFIIAACEQKEPVDGEYAKLAQCLTEKGVKFYGTYWCGHCGNQKKAFGDDFRYITYVECDPQGENGNPQACIDAGVQAYPSWFFPGQGLEVGVQKMETLAQKANCTDALNPSGDVTPATTAAGENPAPVSVT